MHPELFKIPLTELTVKSYGLMMVIGFLVAIFIIRRLSRKFNPDPQLITNAALYALIAGVIGSRIFYVVHYWEDFEGNLLSVFAIWRGGLEFLGGVLAAMAVILFYFYHHKLPVRKYMDVLAIGLLAALAFGRIGCFLNGCCYGKPSDVPWAIKFPYNSPAYQSQVNPDPERNRLEPRLDLPPEYSAFVDQQGRRYLKPFESLTEQQKMQVTQGPYQCLAVHPTQLYSSAMSGLSALLLYMFWRRSQRSIESNNTAKRKFTKPGSTFSFALIVYGIVRFCMEFIRDDNPFEFDRLTVSQYISIMMIVAGVCLMISFEKMKHGNYKLKDKQ